MNMDTDMDMDMETGNNVLLLVNIIPYWQDFDHLDREQWGTALK